jgi:hypothetical protein
MMRSTTPLKKKYLLLRSLILSLAGFLLILFGLNLYQYLRVKSDIASSMLQEINTNELGELRTFFNTINNKLNIVRDWGKNGILDSRDTVSLNKKLFPLIDHQQRISGVLLADNTGWEYFLLQKDNGWLTRRTLSGTKRGTAVYTTWKTPEHSLNKREKRTDYDPRKRPWFHRSKEKGEVFWTPLYTFFETGKKGVTASVSWDATTADNGFYVFGIDISLEEIQKLMNRDKGEKTGIMFLVNPNDNSILPGITGADNSSAVNADQLLASLVGQWKKTGQPVLTAVRFSYDNKPWLGSLQPLVQNNTVFWIGVTAPEKELLTHLNKTLLKVDLTDVLVATAGGILLIFLIWKNGGFRREPIAVDPVVHLHALINQGEGAQIEFKSTVRTNLKTGKKGKEIEFAWLKSVVAFMNSNGGTLLVGVEDSGNITGITVDAFENSDRCLLHIKNLINQHIGAEFSGFLDISLLTTDNLDVVMMKIQRAGQPVFLKIGKNEEFYIRSGPSSIKLSPSQMISYVLQNKLVGKKS